MGRFIQEQVLGMKWLNTLIGNLLTMLGVDISSKIGGSVQFFLYDAIKITVLLCILIFGISYIQSFSHLNGAGRLWEDSMGLVQT